MATKIVIECARDSDDFINFLRKADPSIDQPAEEGAAGVADVIRIGTELSPAVAFAIGCYFSYLKAKVPSITIKKSNGQVISASGDAEQLIKHLKTM
jgi:hypothetical protein